MTDNNFNDAPENKHTPSDWFESIKDLYDSPDIPREWIDYFQKIYAYLEIGSNDTQTPKNTTTTLSKIEKSGWALHDSGNCIATGSGDYAHGLRESDESSPPSEGYGTIVAQSWYSAQAVVEMAKQRWSEGANLIGASPFMQFATGYWAWLHQYDISGLTIYKSDELAYTQIKTLLGQTTDLTSDQRPK